MQSPEESAGGFSSGIKQCEVHTIRRWALAWSSWLAGCLAGLAVRGVTWWQAGRHDVLTDWPWGQAATPRRSRRRAGPPAPQPAWPRPPAACLPASLAGDLLVAALLRLALGWQLAQDVEDEGRGDDLRAAVVHQVEQGVAQHIQVGILKVKGRPGHDDAPAGRV